MDYSIQANPSRGKNHGDNDSYFKFYNSVKYNNETGVCRVEFFSAKFTKDHKGHAMFYPSSKDKKRLMKILNSKPSNNDYIRCLKQYVNDPRIDLRTIDTVWKLTIWAYNIELEKFTIDEILSVNTEMRRSNYEKYKELVPLDLQMPNYEDAVLGG